jgi:hypothetical protein
MTTFQIFYRISGESVHCRIFVGPYEGEMVECGSLVLRPVDFINLSRGAVQLDYIDEETGWTPPQSQTSPS